jgi:purine/pyrimidine-nucleoside phosphorylase
VKVNEYFDGKVKSIGFENSEGHMTCGVMDVGQYEFGTNEKELMRVVSGELEVQLPGSDAYATYPAGTEFKVAAGAKFQVRVQQQSAYLCFYG